MGKTASEKRAHLWTRSGDDLMFSSKTVHRRFYFPLFLSQPKYKNWLTQFSYYFFHFSKWNTGLNLIFVCFYAVLISYTNALNLIAKHKGSFTCLIKNTHHELRFEHLVLSCWPCFRCSTRYSLIEGSMSFVGGVGEGFESSESHLTCSLISLLCFWWVKTWACNFLVLLQYPSPAAKPLCLWTHKLN